MRDLVTDLAVDGKRVKVCVQQALGQGVFQVQPNPSLPADHVEKRVQPFLLCVKALNFGGADRKAGPQNTSAIAAAIEGYH